MDALFPGDLAPDFSLPPAADQRPRKLSDLRGQPVVLAFSPPDWDPSRAEELAQTHRLLSLMGLAGEMLQLSRDGAGYQAAFADGAVPVPLLTDANAARQFGVSGKQALFMLDGEGIIRWRYVAAPGIAPQAEELLAGLSSLRAPAVHGAKGLTRREFLAAALGAALALSLAASSARAETALEGGPDAFSYAFLRPPVTTGTVPVTLTVNGTPHTLQIEPRVTLLDALRERLNLTGSKKGCDHGQCGACTVHVNGRRVNSCLTLAIAAQGKNITTVEGLAAPDGTLHPIQAAFIEHDGFQCGFCTSGQIMSGVALLQEPVGPADADVRENMSGNICRCGAYPNIVAAVQDVRKGGSNAPV